MAATSLFMELYKGTLFSLEDAIVKYTLAAKDRAATLSARPNPRSISNSSTAFLQSAKMRSYTSSRLPAIGADVCSNVSTVLRSEERRVGKESRSPWRREQEGKIG